MAKVYNYITLNYAKDIYTPSIDVVQGDTGRGIIAKVSDSFTDIDASALTATLKVEKPNGEVGETTGTVEVLGTDTIQVTIEPSSVYSRLINVSGIAMASLVVATATQIITSFNFKIKIKENPFYSKPTLRKFDVTKVNRITGIQQYEHKVQSIQFVGIEYTGNVYIVLNNDSFVKDSETEGYHNTIPLTNYTFVIGQPMTFYEGVFECQLLGETETNGETTKFEISPVFYIEVEKSIEQGEETPYPIDPNITFGIDEYIAEQKEQAQSSIQATGDAVIASIPSDYTALEQATYNAYPTESETGNPIYFDDGADDIPVKELIVNLEPKQNLNGYDHPWVGGSGKNLFDIDTSTTYPSKLVMSKPINVTAGEKYTMSSARYDGNEGSVCSVACYNSNGSLTNILIAEPYSVDNLFTIPSGVAYVTISIYFSTEFATLDKAKELKPQFENGSTATAYVPYENICPITGYDGVVVKRTGKNLLPVSVDDLKSFNTAGTWNGNAYTRREVTFMLLTDFNENVTGITVNGTASGGNAFFRLAPRTYDIDSTHIINGCPSGGSDSTYSIQVLQSDDTHVIGNDTGNGLNFNASYDDVNIYIRVANGATVSNLTFKPMIRKSTDDSNFEPYQGEEYSITFPSSVGTVYGGSLNVTTGVLTVDRKMATFDGSSDESWVDYTGGIGGYYISNLSSHKHEFAGDGVCDKFATNAGHTQSEGVIFGINSRYVFFMGAKSIASTITEWTAWLASNPTTIVYNLGNPVTIQLTPTEVSTLLGSNTIQSDGSMELTYRADTTMIIEKLTNAIVSLGGNV